MLQPGDHIVASGALYGGTVTQLKHLARKLGLQLTFVDPDNPSAWSAAMRDETKLVYGETIGTRAATCSTSKPWRRSPTPTVRR